ncbi:MAG TPA: tRNA preQ1(34) S-adenosylmethionine ribosyltransferase-isomerase QueA [Burkholderiaceae bacterium]|nr:tRNA preQ1(34) S-adenosylmethionine ribosyltransferase-isomerase QueA [Burkholderiaceae bacterium]
MPPTFTLSDFDFPLPEALIAQQPAPKRTQSRLLHVKDKTQRDDLRFEDIVERLSPGDLLVLNDTRVIKARLRGTKADTGGKVEVLVERPLGQDSAIAQIRASHPPAVGSRLVFEHHNGFRTGAKVVDRDGRFFLLAFSANIWLVLDLLGEVPLPPYIKHAADGGDAERYQTVYAQKPGAVAAPTAGLHFDTELLARVQAKGVLVRTLTLHVGAGTFLPVQDNDISKHRMHHEWYCIEQPLVDAVNATRAAGRRVVAVGTTSMRALESASLTGTLRAGEAETDLFITPGFNFHTVDRLITNFHLPKSTLLMLVSAFAGYDTVMAAYRHAVEHGYRFFSYGDAMLLERNHDALAC